MSKPTSSGAASRTETTHIRVISIAVHADTPMPLILFQETTARYLREIDGGNVMTSPQCYITSANVKQICSLDETQIGGWFSLSGPRDTAYLLTCQHSEHTGSTLWCQQRFSVWRGPACTALNQKASPRPWAETKATHIFSKKRKKEKETTDTWCKLSVKK